MISAIEIAKEVLMTLKPPPDLKPSEWANSYRRLSSESAARPGKFRIEVTPFMREPMDCYKETDCPGFVMKKSSQVAYSELLNNILGYIIHLDPAPCMMMQPTLEMAESYSKDRISPMVRDSEPLADRIDDRSRTAGNTILHKNFPGGLLQLVGANSPASLASRPIKNLFCDEIDRNPASAGKEGDPIRIAGKRQLTFPDSFQVRGGTPTVKGASRVVKDHEQTDQRVYMVECPRCQEHIELVPDGLVRDKDDENFGKYQCQACGGHHENWEKLEMIKDVPMGGKAYWEPKKPEIKERGYFIWAAYSPFVTYQEIVEEWNDVEGDPELEQVFWNTIFGLEYEFDQIEVDYDALFKRREDYDADRVPEQVGLITAGIDTQDDRFEGEVVGWGPNEESWSLDYFTIEGDPEQKSTLDALDKFLETASYRREDGVELKIRSAFIDSGGHRTDSVYKFCRNKARRRIFACKGSQTYGQPVFARFSKLAKERLRLAIIGTDTAKEVLYARFGITEEQTRGKCHWPLSYSEQYFKGLLAEEKKIVWSGGQPKIRWIKKEGATKRNEPLDCRVYALAAYRHLPMGTRRSAMRSREYALKESEPKEEGEVTEEKSDSPDPGPEKKVVAKKAARRKPRSRGGGGWTVGI